MRDMERYHEQGPFRISTVRGEPYEVEGRRLIPVARIASLARARGTVATDHVGGWGVAITRVRPLAIVEETAEGERSIPIRDATAQALEGFLIAFVVITLLLAAIRWLARRGPTGKR